MDPDAAIDRLMQLSATLPELQQEQDVRQASLSTIEEMRELCEALVEWISRGGFLPHPVKRPGECHGFANRETFKMQLWLRNDFDLYNCAWTHVLCAEQSGDDPGEYLRRWVADDLWHDRMEDEAGRAMFREIGSLWRVDWDEIAATFSD